MPNVCGWGKESTGKQKLCPNLGHQGKMPNKMMPISYVHLEVVKKRLMLLSMWCLVMTYKASRAVLAPLEPVWLFWLLLFGQCSVWLSHSQVLQPLLQLCTAQHFAGGAELCWLMLTKGSGNANTWATASLWALDTWPWVSPNPALEPGLCCLNL